MNAETKRTRKLGPWYWLLVLPYLGLLFPGMYNRMEPAVLGFPFFYWYQFLWVGICAAILGVVYWRAGHHKE